MLLSRRLELVTLGGTGRSLARRELSKLARAILKSDKEDRGRGELKRRRVLLMAMIKGTIRIVCSVKLSCLRRRVCWESTPIDGNSTEVGSSRVNGHSATEARKYPEHDCACRGWHGRCAPLRVVERIAAAATSDAD
jgi:hypothetical protein